jgi:hypothetical protein
MDGEVAPLGERLLVGLANPPLACEDCGRPWLRSFEMWRTYLTDDEPPHAVHYCPECACREFDPSPSAETPSQEIAIIEVARLPDREWGRYVLGAALATSVIANLVALTR